MCCGGAYRGTLPAAAGAVIVLRVSSVQYLSSLLVSVGGLYIVDLRHMTTGGRYLVYWLVYVISPSRSGVSF